MPDLDRDRDIVLNRLAVSRETRERLDLFVALLRRWQPVKNLVAQSTLPGVWTRHVLDSAQLAGPAGQRREVVDLGSGAGFPGLVLAILWADRPGAAVHLVESNLRKAAFLQEAVRVTGAPAIVYPERIEAVLRRPPAASLVTARALAPLGQLLAWSESLLQQGAQALFLKGREAREDLNEAGKSWRLDAELIPSVTESAASLVHVRRAERRGVDAPA